MADTTARDLLMDELSHCHAFAAPAADVWPYGPAGVHREDAEDASADGYATAGSAGDEMDDDEEDDDEEDEDDDEEDDEEDLEIEDEDIETSGPDEVVPDDDALPRMA